MYACTSNQEEKLTNSNWSIEKVVHINTGMINQTKINNEKIWEFNQDHTYRYNTKNKEQVNHINGEWDLDDKNLLIFNSFDSTTITIEEISADNMVWLLSEKDSIRYYLNSREKKVYVPSFPNPFD